MIVAIDLGLKRIGVACAVLDGRLCERLAEIVRGDCGGGASGVAGAGDASGVAGVGDASGVASAGGAGNFGGNLARNGGENFAKNGGEHSAKIANENPAPSAPNSNLGENPAQNQTQPAPNSNLTNSQICQNAQNSHQNQNFAPSAILLSEREAWAKNPKIPAQNQNLRENYAQNGGKNGENPSKNVRENPAPPAPNSNLAQDLPPIFRGAKGVLTAEQRAAIARALILPCEPILRQNRNQAARAVSALLAQKGAKICVFGVALGGSAADESWRRTRHFAGLVGFGGAVAFVDESFSSAQMAQKLRAEPENLAAPNENVAAPAKNAKNFAAPENHAKFGKTRATFGDRAPRFKDRRDGRFDSLCATEILARFLAQF